MLNHDLQRRIELGVFEISIADQSWIRSRRTAEYRATLPRTLAHGGPEILGWRALGTTVHSPQKLLEIPGLNVGAGVLGSGPRLGSINLLFVLTPFSQPKQIHDIKKFLEIARRKDATRAPSPYPHLRTHEADKPSQSPGSRRRP